jgi:hypothetical protein
VTTLYTQSRTERRSRARTRPDEVRHREQGLREPRRRGLRRLLRAWDDDGSPPSRWTWPGRARGSQAPGDRERAQDHDAEDRRFDDLAPFAAPELKRRTGVYGGHKPALSATVRLSQVVSLG